MSANAFATDWLRIVRGEYLEMPGLQLTRIQAKRLWGLDERTCATVLSTLVREQFLGLTRDGLFIRTGPGRRAEGSRA